MKVAVTGAAGFLGQHLLDLLAARGDVVTILSRCAQQRLKHDQVKVIEGTLADQDALVRLVAGVEVVYHLAAATRDHFRLQQVNVEGTSRLLQACIDGADIRRFVHLSSCSVFGSDHSGVITDESPVRPSSSYGQSKLESERRVFEAYRLTGLPVTILRPADVFGDRDPKHHLLQLVKTVKAGRFFFVGHKPAIVNYVYVGDVVRACLVAAGEEVSVGKSYIVSDPCLLRDFVEEIALLLGVDLPQRRIPFFVAAGAGAALDGLSKLTGRAFPLTLNKVYSLCSTRRFSSQRIQNELGFRYPYGWREGLRKMMRWYSENRLL